MVVIMDNTSTLNKCPWCGKPTPNTNLCDECAHQYIENTRETDKDKFIRQARNMIQELQFCASTVDLAILANHIQGILDLIITYIEEH